MWITIRAKLCNLFESYGFGCEQLRASLKQLSKRTIAFAIPAATVEKHAVPVKSDVYGAGILKAEEPHNS